MQKEPFIINIDNENLPNLVGDGESFEYSKTNIWQEDMPATLNLMAEIIEKLDMIIQLLKENGKI